MATVRSRVRRASRGPAGLLVAALSALSCGEDADGARGRLSVLLEPDATIAAGLDPGEEDESIRDGWQVRFERYVISIGRVRLRYASDASVQASDDDVLVIDLRALPGSGLSAWSFDDLRAGRWDFFYSTPSARSGARHDSVSEADFERLQDNDWTYLIVGQLTREEGRSCPPAHLASPTEAATVAGENAAGDTCYENPEIAFSFGVSAETEYGPCEVDGVPGVSVASGGAQTVAATIHGDHLFFNGFPEADEGGILRLAQWLADADLDLDGAVTSDELSSIVPADLPELDSRFQLGGAPLNPIDNLWTYVRAQLMTQGHMDGEGECDVAVPQD